MTNANYRRNIGGGNITAKCALGNHNRLAHPFAMSCSGAGVRAARTKALDSGGLTAAPPPGNRR